MKKTILFVALITILLLTAIACQSNIKQFSSPAEEIDIKNGEQFSVVLESNPTTGYQWSAQYDKEIIKLIDDKYEPLNKNQQIVGAPGKQMFVFKALKKGKTELKFEYARTWEKDSIDSKAFRVTIR